MTNLTSEQYREILHHLEGHTEETPSVQHLLRRAVTTFYSNFRCYPEVASAAPGSSAIFGEQTQFDEGLILALPTPMVTVVVGRRVPGNRVTIVTTADVGKPHKVTFALSHCPLIPGEPRWVNHVKGVMAIYCCRRLVTAFQAAIESNIPLGVGLGSSASFDVAVFTFLEATFGNKIHPIDKAIACQYAEADFLGRNQGIAPLLVASTAQDRNAVLVDSLEHDVDLLPVRIPEVLFVVVDPHKQDILLGEEYVLRSKYLKKACEILGVDNLRNLSNENVELLEEKIKASIHGGSGEGSHTEQTALLDEYWDEDKLQTVVNRARFYVTEMMRIQEAMQAWNEGDVETFGKKMIESHESLKDDFGFRNPILEYLVETSLQAEGVLGSKMIGLGLDRGGCVLTLIYKENLGKYCENVQSNFEENRKLLEIMMEEMLAKKLLEMNEGQQKNQPVTGELETGLSTIKDDEKLQEGLESGNAGIYKDDADESSVTRMLEEQGVVKKKKKCDPSKKRKKRGLKNENMLASLEDGSQWQGLELEGVLQEQGGEGLQQGIRLGKEQGEYVTDGAGVYDLSGQLDKGANLDDGYNGGLGNANGGQANVGGGQANAGGGPDQTGAEEDSSKAPMLSMYIINPIAGARMMFPVKADLLRSRYAKRIPQAKEVIKNAINAFHLQYDHYPEAIGMAPATTVLFGELLEYNNGYIICMALPLIIVTVGSRNNSSSYRVRTTSTEIKGHTEFRSPVPSAGMLELQAESWINYCTGTIAEFKGHVPGFFAIVESNVPCEIGLHSCAAFQASIYRFLEGLTETCTEDPLDKAERCRKVEDKLNPGPLLFRCSNLRFIPTFLCKDGYVLFINSKNIKMAHYYLDNPTYTFLLAFCRENSSSLTIQDLADKIRLCHEATQIIGRENLLDIDERHLECLRKRGASEDMIRNVRYVTTEHQRSIKAVQFIKEEDYESLGMLMTQSHCSLRDDLEISCPEIEKIVNLALSVDGILGAKLVGKGLTTTVLILARLCCVDKCIKHVRKNYRPKRDKPYFYIFKPSFGASLMDLNSVNLIP